MKRKNLQYQQICSQMNCKGKIDLYVPLETPEPYPKKIYSGVLYCPKCLEYEIASVKFYLQGIGTEAQIKEYLYNFIHRKEHPNEIKQILFQHQHIGYEKGDTCNREGCFGQIIDICFNMPCPEIYIPCAYCDHLVLHCPTCDITIKVP